MSDKMEIYYFSPTGGTKKVSDIFAAINNSKLKHKHPIFKYH